MIMGKNQAEKVNDLSKVVITHLDPFARDIYCLEYILTFQNVGKSLLIVGTFEIVLFYLTLVNCNPLLFVALGSLLCLLCDGIWALFGFSLRNYLQGAILGGESGPKADQQCQPGDVLQKPPNKVAFLVALCAFQLFAQVKWLLALRLRKSVWFYLILTILSLLLFFIGNRISLSSLIFLGVNSGLLCPFLHHKGYIDDFCNFMGPLIEKTKIYIDTENEAIFRELNGSDNDDDDNNNGLNDPKVHRDDNWSQIIGDVLDNEEANNSDKEHEQFVANMVCDLSSVRDLQDAGEEGDGTDVEIDMDFELV